METLVSITLVIIGLTGAFLFYKWLDKRMCQKVIDSIYAGQDVMAKWEYTGDMLRKVTEYHFGKSENLPTTAYITPTAILIANKNNKRFIRLTGGVVTDCSYIDSVKLLKFRLRCSKKSDGGRSFYKEDFHIHIPPNKEAEVFKVVSYFQNEIINNTALINLHTPEDHPISIFSGDNY